jgi:hypothetical protein
MAYPPITPLPSAPNRNDPDNFSTEADAFVAALPALVTETNAAGVYTEGQATAAAQSVTDAAAEVVLAAAEVVLAADEVALATTQAGNAATSAGEAATSALAAAATADAVAWVSAASYTAITSNVISPVDFGTYRAKTTHTGVATDPSADATNWTLISAGAGSSVAALTAAATVDISLADDDYFTITLDQDTTFTVSNVEAVDTFNLAVTGADVVTGYTIASASYDSVSFNVFQDGNPKSIAFSTDGTKMFMIGNNDSVYQYTLSTAFNMSTASYDSVSFSVGSQDASATGVTFNTTGTKMFILGNINNAIFQYTLSTAFDVSTASYDSVSFSVASQDASPQEVVFNADGTKMFMLGSASNSVYQYTLSTAFVMSTASYDSVSFSVASQDANSFGLAFNTTGTKMFILGNINDSVFQYTLSTGFNVSTASYDSVSFSVASQETVPYGLEFNNDGTKMYIVGTASDAVFQYTTQTLAPATTTFPASFLFTSGSTPAAPADGVTDILEGQTTDGGTSWYVTELGYAPAVPAALATVQDTKLDTGMTSATTWSDTGLEVTITLADASHKVALFASIATGTENALGVFFKVVRDGTDIALGNADGSRTRASFVGGSPNTDTVTTTAWAYVDSPASVGPHTYKIQWRTSSADSYINRSVLNSNNVFRSRPVSTLLAMERQ